MQDRLSVPVPEHFQKYAEAAICRLRYLHPALDFQVEGDTVMVIGNADVGLLKRDLMYALYREKLAEQSVGAKSRLIDALIST